MNEIVSRQNPRFKTWVSLLDARGIKKSGLAIVSGQKLVEEFLTHHPDEATDLLLHPRGIAPSTPLGLNIYHLASELFNELDTFGTKAPLLVVRTPPLAEWQPAAPRGLELVVALSDPGNLGALLRSAEAFGASRVILTREAASPFLPKALRAASGATFRLELMKAPALAELQLEKAIGLHMEGENLHHFTWPRDTYLILGEEGRGLPESLKVQRLAIPMAKGPESLNAMAAASIALYAYAVQTKS